MRLYLVRHGQSIGNSEKRHQGDNYDTDLTPLGYEQAEKLAKRLVDHKFEVIYSSHLKRAIQTANEINKYHNKEIIIQEKLKERDNGDFAGKIGTDELWENIVGDEMNIKAPNGESRVDQFNRIKPLVDEILNLDKDILIVSHGGTIKSIIASLYPKISLAQVYKLYRTSNTCLYEIEIEDNKNIKILLQNCIRHLDENH